MDWKRNDRLRLRGYAGCGFLPPRKPRQFVFGDCKPRSSAIQANQNHRERQNAGIPEILRPRKWMLNWLPPRIASECNQGGRFPPVQIAQFYSLLTIPSDHLLSASLAKWGFFNSLHEQRQGCSSWELLLDTRKQSRHAPRLARAGR
jgi:hypothetical protein